MNVKRTAGFLAAFALAIPVAQAATSYRFAAPDAALLAGAEKPGRERVGIVRAAPKSQAGLEWVRDAGGWTASFDVRSEGAKGIRAQLHLASPLAYELEATGADGRVERQSVPAGSSIAWGPWTPGERQSITLRSAVRPGDGAVQLGSVVHFDRDLTAKAAAACTVDIQCTTNNAALDAAIAERKRSMARISYQDGGKSFVCTGTLIETEKRLNYFLTANHCIGNAAAAASISSLWFFENTACGNGVQNPARVQISGGMAIVLSDPNTDTTLLQMIAPPPAGTALSPFDPTPLATGTAVTSLSHPTGDVAKLALATVAGQARFPDWPQTSYLTSWTRGIIEGGSSGSGLFTLSANGTLVLRSVLSASTLANGSLSCTNTSEFGVYNRLDVFWPQVVRETQVAPAPVADDHGNRIGEATLVGVGAQEVAVAGNIDYAGDLDVFRITLPTRGTLVARSVSGIDTVGLLLDAVGEGIKHNDDAQTSGLDFGLTRTLDAGTYYLSVSRWESAGTGPYSLRLKFTAQTDNYTDLWWNKDESGWGININHQDDILFATLFTYDLDGTPMWLVASNVAKQANGSYAGDLFRTTGPVFSAEPWNPSQVGVTTVGTIRLTFDSASSATLEYTVNGAPVSKRIEPQRFSTPSSCAWSAFDRSYAVNYQDLWYKTTESGWGVNFTEQGDILFATLFNYGAGGKGVWYVMSNGARSATDSRTFTGPLYRTNGPAFNASPWTAIGVTQVGTMTVAFDAQAGHRATLTYTVDGAPVTKAVERQAFGNLRPLCETGNE
jgi:hypothetical protein